MVTNTFIKAQTTNDRLTENGMSTHSTSNSAVLDLFSKIGAMRGVKIDVLTSRFFEALKEDPKLTTKMLFWVRDIRGGAGERKIFKDITNWILSDKSIFRDYANIIIRNMHLIPEYGRWDDLFELVKHNNPEINQMIRGLIIYGLENEGTRKLVAKWLPRENSSKRSLAKKIIKLLEMTPSVYRKISSKNNEVVENLMCSKNWKEIKYSTVPSNAMFKYRKAFERNDGNRFEEFINNVKLGKDKVNAGALYPYNLVKCVTHNSIENEQWKALPNYMKDLDKKLNIMPIIDTSGSMTMGNSNVRPIDISISLGLYLAERNEGPFKDYLYIFSSTPKFIKLAGNDLYSRIINLPEIVSSNTNLEAVFIDMLSRANKFNVLSEDMPTHLLIITDMEFDRAAFSSRKNPNVMEMIKEKYEKYNYSVPQIIFWNASARNFENVQSKLNDNGVILISGSSPSIIKNVLTGEILNPYNAMLRVLNSDRYKNVEF